MQVELSADLLQSEHSRLALMGILALGESGRHAVLVAPQEGEDALEAYNAWLAGLEYSHLQDAAMLALEEGESKASIGSPRQTIHVSAMQQSGHYPPDEALLILGHPFRVLLENGRYDRNFLLAFANRATRKYLLDAAEHGWLLFETAGGIGETVKRLEELQEAAWAVLRFFCLVDSDAKEEGVPSQTATTVQVKLDAIVAEIGVSNGDVGKVLERRAVENYIDLSALKAWLRTRLTGGQVNDVVSTWEIAADGDWQPSDDDIGQKGSLRRVFFAALAMEGTSPRVWKYFDFSNGRGTKEDRTADSVWNELSSLQKAILQYGFRKKILRDFFSYCSALEQPNLPDPSGELSRILSTIQERM